MTATTDKLLPCPFCNGSEDHNFLTVFETSAGVSSDGMHFYVHCAYCGASGPTAAIRQNAIREWNKRTPIVNAPVGDEYDIVLAKDAIEVAKENNLAVANINVFVLERIITAQAYSQPMKDANGLVECLESERNAIFYAMTRGQEYDIGLAKEKMTAALKKYQDGAE